MATVSTSVASPGQLPPQLPQGPVATPVVASVASATPTPQAPTVTTQVSLSLLNYSLNFQKIFCSSLLRVLLPQCNQSGGETTGTVAL